MVAPYPTNRIVGWVATRPTDGRYRMAATNSSTERLLPRRCAVRWRERVTALKADHGIVPGLAVVAWWVEDPASQVYSATRASRPSSRHGELRAQARLTTPESRDPRSLVARLKCAIRRSTGDPRAVAAADHCDRPRSSKHENRPRPRNVRRFHISNCGAFLGRSRRALCACTPLAALMMLRDHHGSLSGWRRSWWAVDIVGNRAQLLLGTAANRDPCAHSRTKEPGRDLPPGRYPLVGPAVAARDDPRPIG